MEASITDEPTVTVLSKLNERQQPILNTTNLHTEFGVIVFENGRANKVPVSIARRLLETGADVEVPALGELAEQPVIPAPPAGEVVEEPIRRPPGRQPVSPEEQRERAQAAVDHLKAEGMPVPPELQAAANGEAPPPADTPQTVDDELLDTLNPDEVTAVLDLVAEGHDVVLEHAASARVSDEGSDVEVAVRILRQWQANTAAIQASRESASQATPPAASQATTTNPEDGSPPPDPAGSEPQDAPKHSKAIPAGLDALTGEGEPRCLATTGSGKQCQNAAVGATSACGLEPHKQKVAALPDA